MSVFIGVDPGLTGAVACIHPERGLLACCDLPIEPNGITSGKMLNQVDAVKFLALLRDWSRVYDFAQEAVHSIIERPIPMPSLPAQTIACQFDCVGALRGVLTSQGYAPTMANPKDWQRTYGLGKGDKEASMACALRLYPEAPLTRKKHHNRSEAILICHYLMRKING